MLPMPVGFFRALQNIVHATETRVTKKNFKKLKPIDDCANTELSHCHQKLIHSVR